MPRSERRNCSVAGLIASAVAIAVAVRQKFDDLLRHAKLGSYKAPKSLTFVDELPTSIVGKVLRRKVKEKYWQGMERKVS